MPSDEQILVVCTANQCRSPMAAALLRDRLERSGSKIEVVSAGFLPAGVPAAPDAVASVRALGLDIDDHLSSGLTADVVADSDLVVTMTKQHVVELVSLFPEAWPRTMTANELTRRGDAAGPRRGDQPLRKWAEHLTFGRTRTDLLSASSGEDVFDPMGLGRREFDKVRDQLADWATLVADLVAA